MNAKDIIFYGNRDLLKTFEKVPKDKWDIPNVCGTWSTKDVLSHLTSYELLLNEVVQSLQDQSIPTPHIDKIKISYPEFNKEQVAMRKNMLPKEILKQYSIANKSVQENIEKLPSELFLKVGVVPWYGKEYCLDDFIVYLNYGHKKEHLAQVTVFLENLSRQK